MPSNARLLSTYPQTGVTQSEFDLLDDFTNTIHSSLPVATSSALGAVKVGNNLSINSSTGVMSATDTTYSNATSSASGLMSNSDKSRIDGMADNANNYSLPVATSSALGGFKLGSGLSMSSNNELQVTGVGGGGAFLRDIVTDSITVVSGMRIQSGSGSTIPDVGGVRKSPEISYSYSTSVTKVVLFLHTGKHTPNTTTNEPLLDIEFEYDTSGGTYSSANAHTLSGIISSDHDDAISVHWAGSLPTAWYSGIKIRPRFSLSSYNTTGNYRDFSVGGAIQMTAFFY